MITLPQIQKCTSILTSTPIRKATAFLGKISTGALESSPSTDILIKQRPENVIFGENPLKAIKDILSVDTLVMGKDAKVFSIPKHPNLVLRAEKTAVENIANLSEDLRLIPIKHTEEAINRDNLGLPLFSVIDKSSPLYKNEFITPAQALAQTDNIMVLRRVTGSHPMHRTYNAFRKILGMNDGVADITQQLNLEQYIYIRRCYGIQGARKCITELEKNGTGNIPEGILGEGSEAFSFIQPEKFLQNHKEFCKTYLEELKEIAELPQESYQKAVDTILMDKNFLIDFQHTNNTFVDLENKQFNFMDFEYDKTNSKYIYDNPVREFTNVLLGKNFTRKIDHPLALITSKEDVATFKEFATKIVEKINTATPDRFKLQKK